MKRRAGITLVELIVVLVIVAITAAILFPVFAKSRGGHPHITCRSNLRQIGLGVLQYVQDCDELYPPRQAHAGPHGELISWRSIIYPYIKNMTVVQCPDNPTAIYSDIEHDGFHRSYSVNSTTVAKRGASAPFSDVYAGKSKQAAVDTPESVILITESTASFNDVNMTFPPAFMSAASSARNTGALYAGHSGYSSYLFADGHVTALKPLQTTALNGKNLWTRDNSPFSQAENGKAMQVLQYSHKQYPAMHG